MPSTGSTKDRADHPGAGPWVPERLSLSAIRTSAQACEGCDLFRDATQAVVGDGPRDARLMVIGEQPGAKEDLAGEPFVGPAGRLLARRSSPPRTRPRCCGPGSATRTTPLSWPT